MQLRTCSSYYPGLCSKCRFGFFCFFNFVSFFPLSMMFQLEYVSESKSTAFLSVSSLVPMIPFALLIMEEPCWSVSFWTVAVRQASTPTFWFNWCNASWTDVNASGIANALMTKLFIESQRNSSCLSVWLPDHPRDNCTMVQWWLTLVCEVTRQCLHLAHTARIHDFY